MTFRRRHPRLAAAVAFALLLSACGRRQGDLGILPYYPGAQLVSAGEFDGAAFGFGPARWRRTTLVVRAPYERVRDFYAGVRAPKRTSALENESRKATGRRYDRYLSDPSRGEFYAIQVQEADDAVRILLAHGRAASPPPTPRCI